MSGKTKSRALRKREKRAIARGLVVSSEAEKWVRAVLPRCMGGQYGYERRGASGGRTKSVIALTVNT